MVSIPYFFFFFFNNTKQKLNLNKCNSRRKKIHQVFEGYIILRQNLSTEANPSDHHGSRRPVRALTSMTSFRWSSSQKITATQHRPSLKARKMEYGLLPNTANHSSVSGSATWSSAALPLRHIYYLPLCNLCVWREFLWAGEGEDEGGEVQVKHVITRRSCFGLVVADG